MRIQIESPEQQTIFFIIVFLFIFLATIKRSPGKSVFDIEITNEIKGFAILTIVFSHIGYSLSASGAFLFPLSVLGGVGVNLFLFLSGFGLTVSAIKKPLTITQFYKNRLIKLFVPLWISLAVFLVFDKVLLNRTYSLSVMIQSFLGYFPRADLFTSINSPLWFITIILFFYLCFPLLIKIKNIFIAGVLLLLGSYMLLSGNYFHGQSLPAYFNSVTPDTLTLYKLHYAAFPLGMMLAYFMFKIWGDRQITFPENRLLEWVLRIPILLALFGIFAYLAIYSGVGEGVVKEQTLSLLTSFAIIIFLIFKKLRFSLFSLYGLYSYEIYLLHWPFLSRYDIFFKILPPYLAAGAYLLLFLVLGYFLQFASTKITHRFFRV